MLDKIEKYCKNMDPVEVIGMFSSGPEMKDNSKARRIRRYFFKKGNQILSAAVIISSTHFMQLLHDTGFQNPNNVMENRYKLFHNH